MVVVFEFLSLQTCINSWAESLETPSHQCPWGPGGGAGARTGDWHADDLYSKPVFQVPNRACFLQISWGLEGGGTQRGSGKLIQLLPHLH